MLSPQALVIVNAGFCTDTLKPYLLVWIAKVRHHQCVFKNITTEFHENCQCIFYKFLNGEKYTKIEIIIELPLGQPLNKTDMSYWLMIFFFLMSRVSRKGSVH